MTNLKPVLRCVFWFGVDWVPNFDSHPRQLLVRNRRELCNFLLAVSTPPCRVDAKHRWCPALFQQTPHARMGQPGNTSCTSQHLSLLGDTFEFEMGPQPFLFPQPLSPFGFLVFEGPWQSWSSHNPGFQRPLEEESRLLTVSSWSFICVYLATVKPVVLFGVKYHVISLRSAVSWCWQLPVYLCTQ